MIPSVPNWAAVAVLSAGLVLSYYSIRNLNQQLIDATAVPKPDEPPKDRRLDPDAEDKIPLESLSVLAQSHSFELRNAAIKVVAARFMKGSARYRMLSDIANGDWQQREEAINALWLLMYGLDEADKSSVTNQFTEHQTITSLVQGLCNILPDHKTEYNDPFSFSKDHPPSPVRPFQRPVHETSLLIPLRDLLRGSKMLIGPSGTRTDTVTLALEAGLVSKWLTNYPFPCTLPKYSHHNYKKADIVTLLSDDAYFSDDILMADLVKTLFRSFRGRRDLLAAGLMRPSDVSNGKFTENLDRQHYHHPSHNSWDDSFCGTTGVIGDDDDIRMTNGEDTAGFLPLPTPPPIPPMQWVDVPRRPRSMERSVEEDSLRRRHREAIVVAERGVPLTRENVIQRRESTAEEEEGASSSLRRARVAGSFEEAIMLALDEGGPVTVTWTNEGAWTTTAAESSGVDGSGDGDSSEASADSMPELEEISLEGRADLGNS